MSIRTFAKSILRSFGYELTRVQDFSGAYGTCSELLGQHEISDLERLANISLSIPGMIAPRSGQMLYSLCAFQQARGDVVEVGSWQGRSTSFLARAVKDSGNGRFFAIDHFKGNVGKESSYVVASSDLSDLKANFLSNIARVGLAEHVNLLDMPNVEAADALHGGQIRFLFIDGDHTCDGVRKDIKLFVPKLCTGAIVVFDDFSAGFPGLLRAVDEFLIERPDTQVMAYQNTLVVRL